jgi:uncharacterized cupredoxin-like copper-binding protein
LAAGICQRLELLLSLKKLEFRRIRLTFEPLKQRLFGVVVAGLVSVASQAAFAATTVTVELADKGAETQMATGLTYGTTGVDLKKATDTLKPSKTTAKPGAVTFNVTNTSKDLVHEMLVVPVTAGKPLPYLADQMMIDETKVKSKGEVSELGPGKTGSVTVTLTPGTYVLLCNQPGHYEAGMWAVFTVTK